MLFLCPNVLVNMIIIPDQKAKKLLCLVWTYLHYVLHKSVATFTNLNLNASGMSKLTK